jgi:hypothetical protein
MRQLIIKVVLFIGLSILVLYCGETYFIKENRFNLAKVTFDNLSSNNKFNILFFGSSKSYCSYNPSVFRKNLKVNSYNLAGQGQVLEISKFVIEEALKKSKPDLVVVDISHNMIVFSQIDSIAKSKKSYQLRVLDNYSLSANKTKTVFNTYNKAEVVNAISPLIRNHKEWNLVSDLNYKKPYFEGRNNLFLGNNGYIGTLHEMSAEGIEIANNLNKDYEVLLNETNFKLTEREISVIEEIEEIVNSTGSKLLFISAPSIKAYAGHLSFYHYLEQYFASKNQNYLNLNKCFKEIGLTATDFKDTQHMNYSGGYKTSKYVASYIDEVFSLRESEHINALSNNISYHMLNRLEKTKPILSQPFDFNNDITVNQIGSFEEFEDNYVFLFQLDSKITKTNRRFRGYVRFYNEEINDQNKKVSSFPLKTINIEDDIYTFARLNITDTDITKLDFFFIEQGNNNLSKSFTLRDLKLE